jgi:hypothetical protein
MENEGKDEIRRSSSTPVLQTRQKAKLSLVVKSYTEESKELSLAADAIDYITKNTNRARLKTAGERDNAASDAIAKHVDTSYHKLVKSTDQTISLTSTEEVTVTSPDQSKVVVKTTGLVPNAVYKLYNIGAIVDIPTGQTIADNGDALGYYLSDANGQITITKLGSSSFANPNKESAQSFPTIPEVKVYTTNHSLASGDLPNGTYGLALMIPPDGYQSEQVLMEDITHSLAWNLGSSKVTESNETCEVLLMDNDNDEEQPAIPKTMVAPDPQSDPDDPYDPESPDDASNPDDSNDIPIVELEWIDTHSKDKAYRIVDSDNILVSNGNTTYDVIDTLPTMFAFYVQNALDYDKKAISYSYTSSYYYEVTQSEYNAATTAQKSSGEYRMIGGYPMRRFRSNTHSGGDELQDVIVLNQTSPGYLSYSTLDENLCISGAVYNTSWINEKMLEQNNGTYHVAVWVEPQYTYKIKGSNQVVTVTPSGKKYGLLTFKNRQLNHLD